LKDAENRIAARSPSSDHALYIAVIDGSAGEPVFKRLTEAGAGFLAYYRNYVYYNPWDATGAVFKVPVENVEP